MDYYNYLGQGGPPDGLEVMLVSLAIDTRINVIFTDTVCTTVAEGIDFLYPTIMWAWQVYFHVVSLTLRLELLQI